MGEEGPALVADAEYFGRRVLVTGAGGFIGSHLTEALARQGARVRALVHYSSRADAANLECLQPALLRDLEILRGDVRDAHYLLDACAGVEVVFHLAALNQRFEDGRGFRGNDRVDHGPVGKFGKPRLDEFDAERAAATGSRTRTAIKEIGVTRISKFNFYRAAPR